MWSQSQSKAELHRKTHETYYVEDEDLSISNCVLLRVLSANDEQKKGKKEAICTRTRPLINNVISRIEDYVEKRTFGVLFGLFIIEYRDLENSLKKIRMLIG